MSSKRPQIPELSCCRHEGVGSFIELFPSMPFDSNKYGYSARFRLRIYETDSMHQELPTPAVADADRATTGNPSVAGS